MTHAEIQQRIYDADVAEMVREDIWKLFVQKLLSGVEKLQVNVNPLMRKATVHRTWEVLLRERFEMAEVGVIEGAPMEVALATALRIVHYWPIPKEYDKYIRYTSTEGR